MNSTPLNGSVVRLDSKRPPETPPPLRLLSEQLGSLQASCDKLLYRVQQLERREKELLLSHAALKRELKALRKHPRAPAATSPTPRKASAPSVASEPTPPLTKTVRITRTAPAPRLGPEPPPFDDDVPDFGAALSELNG